MVSQEIIQEVVRRLVMAYKPLEIYMYGPYAWGTPDEDDDLKLLIVVESSDEKVHKRSYKAFEALLGLELYKTVAVFTKQEFDKASSDVTSLTYEVKNKGKLLYARG